MAKVRKVVLIQGAFDIIHYGHVRAFQFAKEQGDFLIVALNSNRLIKQYKKRDAVVPWRYKKAVIEAFRCVDKVIEAPDFSPLKLLMSYKVDVYVLSPEWKHTKAVEMAYIREKGGRVCFTHRLRGVSTTAIKERLLKEYNGIHNTATGATRPGINSEPSDTIGDGTA